MNKKNITFFSRAMIKQIEFYDTPFRLYLALYSSVYYSLYPFIFQFICKNSFATITFDLNSKSSWNKTKNPWISRNKKENKMINIQQSHQKHSINYHPSSFTWVIELLLLSLHLGIKQIEIVLHLKSKFRWERDTENDSRARGGAKVWYSSKTNTLKRGERDRESPCQ